MNRGQLNAAISIQSDLDKLQVMVYYLKSSDAKILLPYQKNIKDSLYDPLSFNLLSFLNIMDRKLLKDFILNILIARIDQLEQLLKEV